jgi:hypothetical protein
LGSRANATVNINLNQRPRYSVTGRIGILVHSTRPLVPFALGQFSSLDQDFPETFDSVSFFWILSSQPESAILYKNATDTTGNH